MSTRDGLPDYVTAATAARSITEALGPALLLASLAAGRHDGDGALVIAGFTGLAAVSGPLVGLVLDRSGRPRRVITGGTAVLLLVVGLLVWLVPSAPTLVLVLLACVGGFAHPVLTGGLSAQLPSLVSGPRLDRAYGLDAATYSLGAVIGPPAAAAALALGARGPLLLVAALLLVVLAFVARVPFRGHPPRAAGDSWWRDVASGFRGLASTRALLFSTVVTTVAFAGQAGFLVAVPLISRAQTGSLAASGWVFGVAAVGGILATLVLARRPLRHPDRAVTLSTLGIAATYVVMAFSPSFAVTLVASFVFGAVEGPLITAMFRIRTREADPAVRTSVFTTAASLRTTVYAAMTAVCGALVAVGSTWLLLLGAAIHVGSLPLGLWVQRFSPEVRSAAE